MIQTQTPNAPLTSNTIFYSIVVFIVFFSVALFFILFDTNISLYKSKESIVRTTLIVLFSSLLFFGACVVIVPYLKDFKQFIFQIKNIMYIVLYTIFTILFYVLMPESTLNTYSNIISPCILALGVLAFYWSSNNIVGFDMNYERIKMMIIFVCLIATLSMFYTFHAGSISTILLLVAAVFSLLYTILIFTLPNTMTSPLSFSSFGVYGSILYVAFLAVTLWLMYSQKEQLIQNREKMASAIMFVFIISVLWTMLIGINVFSGSGGTGSIDFLSNIGTVKSGLFAVFSLVISGLFIYWISSNLESFSSKTSIVSFSLNIALVTLLLGLMYKALIITSPSGNAKKNALFGLIGSVLFYIPCMVSSLFHQTGKFTDTEVKNYSQGNLWMLLLSVVLLAFYYYSHFFVNKVNTLGGKLLINQPVPLNMTNHLGTYQTLNRTDGRQYTYAISCWVFMDAAPPNTNARYSEFTPILNYGNKPAMLYHSKDNLFRIVMHQKDLKDKTTNPYTDFDENENRIIYETDHFPLQKWNNIVLNYNGGTLDVFLNGELVKSSIEVSPYLENDSLVVGENGGLLGGICNVVYFTHPLDSFQISYLYNTVKGLSPPVMNDYKDTVVA